jgi:hypothetical protein
MICRNHWFALMGCLLAAGLQAQDYASMTREQKAVVVDGARESWRLQWETQPQPACGPDDLEVALSCQCSGFAYGESGRLALVRMRPGHPQERLELAPFFRDPVSPGTAPGVAVLQRWRTIPAAAHDEDDDWHHAADFDFLKRVQARGSTELMKFGDYNHDGHASEFLLQVGVRPCGRPQMVLVGVSRRNPQLHVFATAEMPDQPLALPPAAWSALLKGRKQALVEEASCGDPGIDAQVTLTVTVQRGVFHAQRQSRPCPSTGAVESGESTGY